MPYVVFSCNAPRTKKALLAKLKKMDSFAENFARSHKGEYDGNGIGFGNIDEFLIFKSLRQAEIAATALKKKKFRVHIDPESS